jgi:hypothetical protein
VEYEKDKGELKFLVRNKKELLLLTNVDVQEKEGAGGLRKKGMVMVAAADTEKVVSFAKKDEAGARKCGSCGFSHTGPCTQQTTVQTKYDQSAPFIQKINDIKNIKEQAATMGGLIDMLGHNARPPPLRKERVAILQRTR